MKFGFVQRLCCDSLLWSFREVNNIICHPDNDMRLEGNPTKVYAGSDTIVQDYPRQITRGLTYILGIISWVYILICASVQRLEVSLECCFIQLFHFVFFLRQGVSLVWNLSNK